MKMICQPAIYIFPVNGEKGGLCINDINTSKLYHE